MRHYSNGEWSDRDYPWFESLAWDEKEKWVLEENMSTEARIGALADDMGSLTLLSWHHPLDRPEGAPEYLISVELHSKIHQVSAETLTDALDLMGRWSPMVTAEILSNWRDVQAAQEHRADWETHNAAVPRQKR